MSYNYTFGEYYTHNNFIKDRILESILHNKIENVKGIPNRELLSLKVNILIHLYDWLDRIIRMLKDSAKNSLIRKYFLMVRRNKYTFSPLLNMRYHEAKK